MDPAKMKDEAQRLRNIDFPARADEIEEAADEIGRLRERCAYAEEEKDRVSAMFLKRGKRIAALEAALSAALTHITGGIWPYIDPPDVFIKKVLKGQALTSSEGAGETANGPQCACKFHPDKDLIVEHSPGCPIHSPTSAAEDREDG